MRAIVDTKGEAFAYLQGTQLFSLEGELCGRLEGEFIVDLAGQPKWRVSGDGIYTLDGFQPIGYLGGEMPEEYSY
jgi:hypothetical protein